MNSEYTAPEVVEIGKAQEVILGIKGGPLTDNEEVFPSDGDLDE